MKKWIYLSVPFLIMGLIASSCLAAQPINPPKTLPSKGLFICVGGMDEKEVGALQAEGRIIHALYTNRQTVVQARRYFLSKNISGTVSASLFDGQNLPYLDNLVNVVIIGSDGCDVPKKELTRVLVPKGMALSLNSKSSEGWSVYTKPTSKTSDSWSHYLYDASGNPVSDDDVKPPRQLQWVSHPKWARHHEHLASMTGLVSSDGKVFSICDEGPLVSALHPPAWKLSAHDAYNGLQLWEQPIDEWLTHLHKLKSGPASLPRRLVAHENKVYVTMGIDAPVSILDAETGETKRTCNGTEKTREIILSEHILFLMRDTAAGPAITAVNAETGQVLWNKQRPIATLTLAANKERVVFYDGQKIVSLNRKDGSEQWVSEPLEEKAKADWMTTGSPRLILAESAIVVAPKNKIIAVSTDGGTVLWSEEHPMSGYKSPKDLFIINGLVWYGETDRIESSGRFVGRDLITGEIKRSFIPDIEAVWLSHHRCHFSKATKNFIISGRMGVEFVDINKEKWNHNPWVRGGCLYGFMPANGLLYTPPHACACYFEAKQEGYSAYTSNTGKTTLGAKERLQKGPAYGSSSSESKTMQAPTDWPVFRHDATRSGHSESTVKAELKEQWSVHVGSPGAKKLTQPVVADGRIFVAATDNHTLHVFNTQTGKPLWQFIAGGRIDSPPSIYKDMAIFGSRDGWVYCLRCSDGALIWRFRGVPKELMMMCYGQLESAWPVHGSVLIEKNEIHCVAGRNMFLDGGLRYLRLEPTTGKLISETIMDDTDPIQGGSIHKYDTWLDMTVTKPDILSSDGETIYMRSQPFDLEGKRRRIFHVAEKSEKAHLFSPNGYLEDSWHHRSYWTYGRTFPGGWMGHLFAGRYNPSGRIMALDGSTIYGYGRQSSYYKWTTSLEYQLFAVNKADTIPKDIYPGSPAKNPLLKKFTDADTDRSLGLPTGKRKKYPCKWIVSQPTLHARAMVSTKEFLFVAGPQDIMDEQDFVYKNVSEEYEPLKADSKKQAELWTGSQGAILMAVSKKDGAEVASHKIDSLPAFDGMIAAENKLFISLSNGKLTCLK